MSVKAKHTPYSIAFVQEAVNGGNSVRAIVEEHLKAIEDLEPKINAITTINPEALEYAEQLDVGVRCWRSKTHIVQALRRADSHDYIFLDEAHI